MFKRSHIQTLKKRIGEKRKFIQILLGPRQTGKTTIVRQLLKEINIPYHYIAADTSDTFDGTWISQQWEAARIKLKTEEKKELLLVIDEVQKIDNWSNTVKTEWDKDSFEETNIKVILLGSARVLIQKGLSESLSGRFETIPVLHWSFNEMNEAFGFTPEEYVYYGAYPGAADLIKDESRWKAYITDAIIETTISKDILMMARIDKPSLLKKVFELACNYSGQILSFTKILGELQDAGNTTTLSHYAELLDYAGLVTGLAKIYKEIVRQRSSIPKWQVYNNALLSSTDQRSFKEVITRPEIFGRYIESAIGAHLINTCKQNNIKLYYWRHVNHEVDFVLQKDNRLIGIEVKSNHKKYTRGMSEFKKRFDPDKILLVGSSGLDWKEFIRLNPDELFR